MSGINHPSPRFISPTNDFNRSGGEGTINVNVQPNMNELSNRTSQRIFQVASESPESSELLVSSWYRRSGTPFDFTSNIGGPLFRPRLIQLRHVIMPQILNINRNNNQFCFQFVVRIPSASIDESRISNPINVEFTMPPKFYTPDTFGSDFNSVLSTAIIDQFPGNYFETNRRIISIDQVAVSSGYDEEQMRFTLDVNISQLTFETVNPPGPPTQLPISNYIFKYWMTDDCSFIRRGKNFIDFPDAPRQPLLPEAPDSSVIPPPGTTDAWFPPTGPAVGRNSPSSPISAPAGPPLLSLFGPQFIYTRYVTISSEALSLYAYGESRVDRSGILVGQQNQIVNTVGGGGGGGKIIGVISTSQFFFATKDFAGANRITAVDAPSIGIKNSQLKLNEFIDFSFVDEFGFTLDDSFPQDNNWGPTLAFIVGY